MVLKHASVDGWKLNCKMNWHVLLFYWMLHGLKCFNRQIQIGINVYLSLNGIFVMLVPYHNSLLNDYRDSSMHKSSTYMFIGVYRLCYFSIVFKVISSM